MHRKNQAELHQKEKKHGEGEAQHVLLSLPANCQGNSQKDINQTENTFLGRKSRSKHMCKTTEEYAVHQEYCFES